MGAIRLIIRLPLILLHVVLGTPATVIAFYRPFRGIQVSGESLRDVMLRWWARTMCRIFGVRVQPCGKFPDGPQLVVANHISWLDIQVLHSLSPMSFVAKSEIEEWPLTGFLARVGGTVFHTRGSHHSARGVIGDMAERLSEGHKVAIFAEGGILPGFGVKRFHAMLFAAAIETGTDIQPVAVRYLRNGAHFKKISFREGEGLVANFFRLLSQPGCIAQAFVLKPLPSTGSARRQLALATENSVRAAFDSEVPADNG